MTDFDILSLKSRYDQNVGQERIIIEINLAEAKTHLSELVVPAKAGETTRISLCGKLVTQFNRRGKPVAQFNRIKQSRLRIDLASLQAVTGAMPENSADNVVRAPRGEARRRRFA